MTFWILVLLIIAVLLSVPLAAVGGVLWFEGLRDRRYRAETPLAAAWERHCRTTPGLIDLGDEAAWEQELTQGHAS